MRTASRLAGALAVLLAAAPALATNGMRMTGFGPVQNSMGGVGVGATLDANAVVSNPAGLPELGNRVDVGLTWFKPTVDYKAGEALPPGFPAGSFVTDPGATIKSKRGGSLIPAIAANFALSPDFALGLGLAGVAGMGANYPSNLYGGTTVSSYMQARLAPGFGWNLGKMLSVGATLNIMMAQMSWEAAGRPRHDTQSSYGWGATFGLKFRPIDELTIGVAYETTSKFNQFVFKIPTYTANTSAGPVTFPGGNDRLRFDQPPVLTLGLAVAAMEGLLLAADLEWIRWSETNGRDQPTFTTSTAATGSPPWNLNWSDQLVLKLGAQYKATRALTVRVGYNYGRMPLDQTRAFENIAFPAIAEYHLSAGASYDFSKALAVAVGLTYSPKATLKGNNANEQGISYYTTNMSQIAVDAGLSYKF